MAEFFQTNDFVTSGELRTAQRLKTELPKGWKIVANKMLPSPNGTTHEVDFIIVGDHRVFIVDEKGYRGKIYGDESYWSLDSRESRKNPLDKMEYVAKIVATRLRRNVSGLENALGGAAFVDAIVILSDPSVQLLMQEQRRSQIMRLDDASRMLLSLDTRDERNTSIVPFRDHILQGLQALPPSPSLPRAIGAYTITEKLTKGSNYRAFLAEHEASGPNHTRRLKVYELSGLGDEERESQKNLIYRDFTALAQLATEGLVPAVDPPFPWGEDRFIVVPQHPAILPSLRVLAAPAGILGESVALTPQEALDVGRSLLKSLARLHELGVLHRNLTPDNVFVDRSAVPWRTILADFDFARLPETESISPLADALEVAGPYRAPELAVSLSFASEKSDVYAAGVMLTEMLAGVRAQDATDETGQIQVPALNLNGRELPKGSDEILLRQLLQEMVCKDERKRWAGVQEALDLIQEQAPKLEPVQEEIVEVDNFSYQTPRLFQRGDVIDKQYEVEGILGQGATATTYLVLDRVFGGNYVLKQIRDVALAHHFAATEFNVLSRLAHPGIMRIYDVKLPESTYHLKIEFVEGTPLDELRGEFPWPAERVLSFGKDILAALTYLEVNGIAHRDLSARNIIITKDGPKLIDFGLASPLADVGKTQIGTIAYRAPELDRGESWNSTSDTYSAGVLLFWMLTGKYPFEADANGRINKSYLVEVPVSESDDSRLLSILGVLRRALATSPEERFQSATDMSNALQASVAFVTPIIPTDKSARASDLADTVSERHLPLEDRARHELSQNGTVDLLTKSVSDLSMPSTHPSSQDSPPITSKSSGLRIEIVPPSSSDSYYHLVIFDGDKLIGEYERCANEKHIERKIGEVHAANKVLRDAYAAHGKFSVRWNGNKSTDGSKGTKEILDSDKQVIGHVPYGKNMIESVPQISREKDRSHIEDAAVSIATYRATRLLFRAAVIEPLLSDEAFRIVTPDGAFQMTKAEFYRVFANVVASASYREHGIYHSKTVPKKALQYRVE